MWTDWLTRLIPPNGPEAEGDANQRFVKAVAEAKAREAELRPLSDQLTFARRVAESEVPIDRATVPLNLSLGPDKVKELAAQVKLSPYLKDNLQTLMLGYREDVQALQRAERAVEELAKRPRLRIAGDALTETEGLFASLAAGREQFRDYPLFYQLLGGAPGPSASEAAEPAVTDLPSDLAGFFSDEAREPPATPAAVPSTSDMGDPKQMLIMLGTSPVTLELGLDLVPFVDPALGGDLMDRVGPMRVNIVYELGFIMPGIQFKDNLNLRPNTYRILVRDLPVATGELLTGYMLAVEQTITDSSEELVGFSTVEPAFGKPAYWVTGREAKRALRLGYLVIDPVNVLIAHLDETVRRHAHEMLSLDEVQLMVDHLSQSMPHAVSAVYGNKLELPEYHLLLKGLLRERVSIRDQATILESVAHAIKPLQMESMAPSPVMFNVMLDAQQPQQVEKLLGVVPRTQSRNEGDGLLGQVRIGLSRQICQSVANDEGILDVVTLDPRAEETLLDALQAGHQQELALPPGAHDQLVRRLTEACAGLEVPVLLVQPRLRSVIKRLTMRALPRLTVLSFAEIHPDFRAQSIDRVSLSE
ncbi:MAG: FHIPEP family type III secretion protein [Candidatus Sericytochromatia bacterium]